MYKLKYYIRLIDKLKLENKNLHDEISKKNDFINSIEKQHDELNKIVIDLKTKQKEYNNLLSDIKQMKQILNKNCFKGRWRLIKFLMR